MEDEVLHVAVFGSCRAVASIVPLQKSGVEIVNRDNLWYTHSAPETLQKIDLLTGARRLPAETLPFVVDDNPHPADWSSVGPGYFAGTDVALVELSSSRVLRGDGVLLHPTCVNKLEAKGMSFPHELRELSDEESWTAMERLSERFPKLLFMTPILLALDLQRGVAARQRIHDLTAAFCAGNRERRVGFYDPMTAIKALGAKRALIDNSHFSEAGFNAVRRDLHQRLRALQRAKG